MSADGVALLIYGLRDGFIVGAGLPDDVVDAGAELVYNTVLLLMIRVVSLGTVQGCDSFALVQACIGGFVALDPSHEIGVLHGGWLVGALTFEGFGVDVKGLDSERHVVYILDLVVS
jgi:hypothetical protein